MKIIQLCGIILLFAQLTIADTKVDPVLGPHYEYDTNRSGWFVPSVQVNPIRLRYANVPAIYQDFVNRTLSRQPAGVCQKEVP